MNQSSATKVSEPTEATYCTPERVQVLQDTIRHLAKFTSETKKRRNRNEVIPPQFSPFAKSSQHSSLKLTTKGITRSNKGGACSFVYNSENVDPAEKLQEEWKSAPQKFSKTIITNLDSSTSTGDLKSPLGNIRISKFTDALQKKDSLGEILFT
jgi:hypothetical protein